MKKSVPKDGLVGQIIIPEGHDAYKAISPTHFSLAAFTLAADVAHKKSLSYINIGELMGKYDKVLAQKETNFEAMRQEDYSNLFKDYKGILV